MWWCSGVVVWRVWCGGVVWCGVVFHLPFQRTARAPLQDVWGGTRPRAKLAGLARIRTAACNYGTATRGVHEEGKAVRAPARVAPLPIPTSCTSLRLGHKGPLDSRYGALDLKRRSASRGGTSWASGCSLGPGGPLGLARELGKLSPTAKGRASVPWSSGRPAGSIALCCMACSAGSCLSWEGRCLRRRSHTEGRA